MLGLNEKNLSGILENAPLPIYFLDSEGNIQWANRAWLDLLGYEMEGVEGRKFLTVVAPESFTVAESSFKQLLKCGSVKDADMKVLRRDGVSIAVSANCNVVFDEGRFLYAYGILFDISERKRLEELHRQMSMSDQLTGLYNKDAIMEIIGTEITRYDRYGGEFSILMVDVNGMSAINETYGRHTGDLLLVQTSRHLSLFKRTSDRISRYDGDEFLVVLPGTGADGALVYAEKLTLGVVVPVSEESSITVPLSFGIAEFTEDIDDAEDLVTCAYEAMKSARQDGISTVSLHQS